MTPEPEDVLKFLAGVSWRVSKRPAAVVADLVVQVEEAEQGLVLQHRREEVFVFVPGL